MASKRKPLDDARRRVKEKLNAIDEQKEFIQNSVDQLTSGVKQAAKCLLTEGNKTKFFQKYRAVSQELEKCLDDLLLISATISSLEDGEEGESDEEEEEDEKPPDEISPTRSNKEHRPITNDSKHEEINQGKSLPADEKPCIIPSPTDCAKTFVDRTYPMSNATSALPHVVNTDTTELNDNKISTTVCKTEDLILFEQPKAVSCINETVSASSYSSYSIPKKTGESSIQALKDSNILPITDQTGGHATTSFDLIKIDQSYLSESLHRPKVRGKDAENNKQLHNAKDEGKEILVEKSQDSRAHVNDLSESLNLSKVCEKEPKKNKQLDTAKDEGKEIAMEKSLDSTAYVNEFFMASPPMCTTSESVAAVNSRKSSFEEIKGNILELNISTEVENEPSSPTAVRLQRIGFCAYKSHEREADLESHERRMEGGEFCESVVDPASGEIDPVSRKSVTDLVSCKGKTDSMSHESEAYNSRSCESVADPVSYKGETYPASHGNDASHKSGVDHMSRKRKADSMLHENEAYNSLSRENVAGHVLCKGEADPTSDENDAYSTSHKSVADPTTHKGQVDPTSRQNKPYSPSLKSRTDPVSGKDNADTVSHENEACSPSRQSVGHSSSYKAEVYPTSYKNKACSPSQRTVVDPASRKDESFSMSYNNETYSQSHQNVGHSSSCKDEADPMSHKNKAYAPSQESLDDPSLYNSQVYPISYETKHKSLADPASHRGELYSTIHKNKAYSLLHEPASHTDEADSEIIDNCGKAEIKVEPFKLSQITDTTVNPEQEPLHKEGNKTKFFQKYRAVSQELEKCLDDLLLISATISSLEDGEEGESDEEEEEDEKPPDEISPTRSNKAEYKHGTWSWDGKSLKKNAESEFQPKIERETEKAATSPISAGDVIEEAFREKTTCKITDVQDLHIPVFEIPTDKCMRVTVKEIVSVREFWIQKANDDLDFMMEKMCFHFSKRAKTGDKGGLSKLPTVGHVCCARYTGDDVWYRALVTAVSHEDECAQVLYVDEGNSERLPLSRLRELDEKFARLPCQALLVQLRGLELSEDFNVDEVNDWFRRRVSGEILEAIVNGNDPDVAPMPLDFYIRPHAPRSSTSDHGEQKLEHNILEMLIREGFAIRGQPLESTGTSSDASPPSSPSDQLIKSESVVSSSVTSGFHETVSPTLDVQGTEIYSPLGFHGSGVIRRVPAPVIPVDSDGSVFMLVSHVVNPGEFYVHFVSSEAGMLDNLMTDMNEAYQDVESQDYLAFSPRLGDFCCAKFLADGNWYRGLVLQVRVGDSGEENGSITVEVFYIDFGNIEHVTVEDLRELLPQFMLMPAQVVRCSLADINPSIKQAMLDNDVFYTSVTTEEGDDSNVRLSRRRSHKHKVSGHIKAIPIAAGDEDDFSEDEFPTMIMEPPEIEQSDRLRSSISDEIAKSHRGPFSDTAVELFEKVWQGVEHKTLKPNWSGNATEYFKSLTENAQKLVGYVVPWDFEMLNRIVNYSQGGECSLPNLGPVLRLNLYDVSNDDDMFVNAAMVRAKYASSSSIKENQDVVAPVIPEDASCTLTEVNPVEEVETLQEDVPVVRLHQRELCDLAEITSEDSTSTSATPLPSLDSSLPASPLGPTLLDSWNPMSDDYEEFRNAYNVKTDNLDVAITGYEEDRGKICRFYRTKYGCYRGSKCPDKHIERDVSDQVLMIYGSPANCLKLPDIGTWVMVKITAIYDPAHFWVQLPYGIEDLTTQLIKGRSGGETSGEENLKEFNNLMKQMSEFYSKTFRRQRSLVPPVQGELVIVRSERDNKWYRGQVCEEEKDGKYKILILDYGITEWIDRGNICPIMPQFLHLPFQSVECYLANISPTSGEWSEEARQYFKSLIEDKLNELLVCQILSIGLNKTMLVNLFETTETGESQSVKEEMIKSGFAEEAKFKIVEPVDLKLLQAAKSIITHPG